MVYNFIFILTQDAIGEKGNSICFNSSTTKSSPSSLFQHDITTENLVSCLNVIINDSFSSFPSSIEFSKNSPYN